MDRLAFIWAVAKYPIKTTLGEAEAGEMVQQLNVYCSRRGSEFSSQAPRWAAPHHP